MTKLTQESASDFSLAISKDNSQQIIEVKSTEIISQYPVNMTQVLLQQPYSPFALALSISLVIGSIAAVIKILKSSPQEWESMGKSASMVIRAFTGLLKVVKSQDKH